VRPEAPRDVPGWSSSGLVGPCLARGDLGQPRVGGRGQVVSYRDGMCNKWRRAPATVHLPLDVTRLRDKPAQPALRRPGSRLLRNHGVFTGKPRPSLGSMLTLVARRGNLWDHPHSKVFRPGGCLRRGGKGPSRASPSGPSPVQPGRVWGPLGDRPGLLELMWERTGGLPSSRTFILGSGAPLPHYADSYVDGTIMPVQVCSLSQFNWLRTSRFTLHYVAQDSPSKVVVSTNILDKSFQFS
jgi:hypothetical protein